jgi:hypothetical protein
MLFNILTAPEYTSISVVVFFYFCINLIDIKLVQIFDLFKCKYKVVMGKRTIILISLLGYADFKQLNRLQHVNRENQPQVKSIKIQPYSTIIMQVIRIKSK